MQATFKINVKIYWNKSGDFEILDSSIENGDDEELDEDENGVDENNNTEGFHYLDIFQRTLF
jgi:hypothetical protein